MNEDHKTRLVKMMYGLQDLPELDEYGTGIFGRTIRGTWPLLRRVAETAVADIWTWSPDKKSAGYPANVEVPTFEEFATFMLHESAHGWCYFLKKDPSQRIYVMGVNEEQVCWDVSRLACQALAIPYRNDLADLCYQFYMLGQSGDLVGLRKVVEKMPIHACS